MGSRPGIDLRSVSGSNQFRTLRCVVQLQQRKVRKADG